jgi:hypothetical protein
VACALKMRPWGLRARYRGALALWLTVVTVPATAQVGLVTGQGLIGQAGNNYAGDHLAAGGGLIYTNNVQRTEGGSSQTLLLLGLSGDLSHEGPRLDYRLASNLAVLKYLGGAYPTQPSGYLDGAVYLKIVPGFFTWLARETYSQLQIDPYLPATPHNLENINYLTTGPRFTMRPTLRTSVTLEALYSYLVTSSSSPLYVNLDNQRYQGNLRIERAFSEAASLYIKADYAKIDFKDQVENNNYAVGGVSGGYRLSAGRTVLDISGGYSRVHVYDVLTEAAGAGSRETRETQTFESPIWALDVSRLITPNQRLALLVSQQFTDPLAAFRLGFDSAVPFIAPQGTGIGAEAFRLRLFGLNWAWRGSRTSLEVGLSAAQQRYVLSTVNDYNFKTANVLLNRQLSPVLSWDISVSYYETQQVGAPSSAGGTQTVGGQSAKTFAAFTGLRWQVGERLGLTFFYGHSSQQGAYRDNQIGVTASWALIGAQGPVTQAFPALTPTQPYQ